MPSFSTPLSGLNANSQDLSVVSNNLANLNTVGYKSQVTNFQDLFYQQIGTNGAGNPLQVGVGTKIDAISGNFTQGSISATGVPTDVAIQGQGFLTLVNNGLTEFTRAGNLSVTTNGSLVTADGGNVQGYEGVNGVINPSQALGSITIPTGLTSPPHATTNVALTLNLDSGTPLAISPASQQTGAGIAPATVLATGGTLAFTDGTNAFTYTTVAGNTLNNVINAINANPNFTAGLSGNSLVINAVKGTAVTFTTNTLADAATGGQTETFAASSTSTVGTFATSIAVNDALGASHVLTFKFAKTAANSWNYSITIPAADVGAAGNPVVLKSGTLTFSGSGQLISPAANVAAIPITGFADGASNLSFNWQLFDPNSAGLLTQVSGASATSSTLQDGFASGTLSSYTIDNSGTIQGVFTNGQTIPIAQIALATFSNVQGLQRNGSNNFLESLASGAANIGVPDTAGRGTVNGGSLELSNADIATEFSQLILAERGYEANARAITTFDQVTQDAINLKQ
ncbi:MAG: flagellar hook protein FlgE [Acidobacteriia bacterium]|nr:flagellar hook protein FlgE [Terriglobia bacterium]